MTNDLVDRLRQCWASKKLQKEAADLIEQLQRERDEARDRLAKAERDADIREDFAHDYGHDEGFRAGIEAAADVCSVEKDANEILALTPTDKPAAPSVAEAARLLMDWAAKEYIEPDCYPKEHREPGCASCDLFRAFEIIADGLADYKTEDTELHRSIRALAAREGE